MTERGAIRNNKQVHEKDFTKLRWGNITPTDLDGFIDFGDKICVFIESKYENGEPSNGQRLALERLCNNCYKAGRESYILLATHGDGAIIDYAPLSVIKFYYQSSWHNPIKPINVKDFIDSVLDRYGYYTQLKGGDAGNLFD